MMEINVVDPSLLYLEVPLNQLSSSSSLFQKIIINEGRLQQHKIV